MTAYDTAHFFFSLSISLLGVKQNEYASIIKGSTT
jgi:hypothetical protein